MISNVFCQYLLLNLPALAAKLLILNIVTVA